MPSLVISFLAALLAQQAASHATFQDLWVNGVDKIRFLHPRCYSKKLTKGLRRNLCPSTAVKQPRNRRHFNRHPLQCWWHKWSCGKMCRHSRPNCDSGNASGTNNHHVYLLHPSLIFSKQPGDRSCANEAIGGDHFGPVQVYMSKVSDASTADGSTGWFKVFEDTWANVGAGSSGSTDNWGTKDLNTCCGKMNVKVPSDIPAGDYLLRAEVIALHVASSTGGAQFYTSCCKCMLSPQFSYNYQITIATTLHNIHAESLL